MYCWQQLGKEKRENLFQGQVSQDFSPQATFQQLAGKLLNESTQAQDSPLRYREILYGLADLYCQGYQAPWQNLYGETPPALSHLPTYPFTRSRYWLDESAPVAAVNVKSRNASASVAALPVKQEPVKQAPVLPQTAMLKPVWDMVLPTKQTLQLSNKVVVIGASTAQQAELLCVYPKAAFLSSDKLSSSELPQGTINHTIDQTIDHIVWIAPENILQSVSDESLIEQQEQGVIQVFRLLKTLLGLGFSSKALSWTSLTTEALAVHPGDTFNPTHASVHGLVGTLAKEYPAWQIRLVDLPAKGLWPWSDVLALAADAQGDALAYRGNEWFQQGLISVQPPQQEDCPYRFKGVYVVIGGAGGIGETWSRYVVEHYQAHIIWIGRRPQDARIQAKLDSLAQLGPRPVYIQADATQLGDLQQAYQDIKQIHPQVHGVIHSAVGVFDQSLAQMSESHLREILSVKIDLSVRIAQVFEKGAEQNTLDFVLFFSSMSAFGKAAGMAGYAAGCVFKDAFAQRLAQQWPCAVKVMNWGYWDIGVGDAVSSEIKIRLKQEGVSAIAAQEGMQALNTLLAGPIDQIAFHKEHKLLSDTAISEERVSIYPASIPSKIKRLAAAAQNKDQSQNENQNKRPQQGIMNEEMNGLMHQILFAVLHQLDLLSGSNISVTAEANIKANIQANIQAKTKLSKVHQLC